MKKYNKIIQHVANCDNIYCEFANKQYDDNGCICNDCIECFEEEEQAE